MDLNKGVNLYRNCKEIIVEKRDRLLVIKFNNPKKRNCVNRAAYGEITRVLLEVAGDEDVTIVVFTGVGQFYTAGNDLSQSSNVTDMDTYIREMNALFKKMVVAFIECPKIVVSLVNGPCIGIGTTLAGLSDLVWCSETAYFVAPFTKLGIVPEACSSYLFPLLMGRSRATEMLLFGEKLTPQDAYRCNFVSRVFKLSELDSVVWPKLREFANLPPGSLQVSKRLLRMHEKDALFKALDAECEELYKRFHSDEVINAVIQFSQKKSSKL